MNKIIRFTSLLMIIGIYNLSSLFLLDIALGASEGQCTPSSCQVNCNILLTLKCKGICKNISACSSCSCKGYPDEPGGPNSYCLCND